MNLSEIRDLFVEISGRADLVQTGVVANADFYIREGSKELDRRLFGGKAEGRYTTDIDQGQILVPMPSCRAIKGVWLYTAEGKTKLYKADGIDEIKEMYSTGKTAATQGTPGLYLPINTRSIPEAVIPADYNRPEAFDDVIVDTPSGQVYPNNYVLMNTGGALISGYHNKHIIVNSATDQILTLPAASDVYGIGTTFIIEKVGIGRLTIQCIGSDVVNDSTVNGTIYCDDTGIATLTITFVGVSTWVASGSNIWTTT